MLTRSRSSDSSRHQALVAVAGRTALFFCGECGLRRLASAPCLVLAKFGYQMPSGISQEDDSMTRMRLTTLSLALVLAGAMSTTADAGCRRAGGEATMITKDLAVFMANAALKNSIADHGERPKGAVALSCKDDTFT